MNENRKYADNTYNNDNPMEADNPPIESYADQFANQDADMDYPPDEDHEGHEDHEDDGKGLIPQHEFERLRRGAERIQRPLSFLKCSKDGIFTLNDVAVGGACFLAIPDWVIVNRTLWVNGKPVETHGHLWRTLNGPPPRPPTFTDRTRWAEYDPQYKSDPWRIGYVLPLQHESSNGIVTLQAANEPTKFAIMRLLGAFNNRQRPIVELTREKDPDSKDPAAFRPELKIAGFAETNTDFGFLADMLIKDDPEYPEPPAKKWDDL